MTLAELLLTKIRRGFDHLDADGIRPGLGVPRLTRGGEGWSSRRSVGSGVPAPDLGRSSLTRATRPGRLCGIGGLCGAGA
ncbi:hypothetical protein ACTG9Q_12995 [Actinokineospora sp. 24-640]